MKAISIRSPWWWFILHAGKDIENRDWSSRFRGPVLVHASKWHQAEEIADDAEFAAKIARKAGVELPRLTLGMLKETRGCIVGRVDIIDCVSSSSSPWFFGEYGFVLANPVAFARPVPFKGALSFFDVPDEIANQAAQAAA